MKKWLIILLIIAVVGIATILLIYTFYLNKGHKDIEKTDADFKLKTETFYKEYSTNRVHSDSLYSGKVIEISGKVDKIETSDSLVIAVFVFTQDDFGDAGIRCTMLPKYNEESKKITAGSVISIKGLCSGYNDTDVILEKCSLVNN